MPTITGPTKSQTSSVPRVEPRNDTQKYTIQYVQHTTTYHKKSTKNHFLYPIASHIYNDKGKKETIDSLRSSPQKDVWEKHSAMSWADLPKATFMESMLQIQSNSFETRKCHQNGTLHMLHLSVITDPSRVNDGEFELLLVVTDFHMQMKQDLRQHHFWKLRS